MDNGETFCLDPPFFAARKCETKHTIQMPQSIFIPFNICLFSMLFWKVNVKMCCQNISNMPTSLSFDFLVVYKDLSKNNLLGYIPRKNHQ